MAGKGAVRTVRLPALEIPVQSLSLEEGMINLEEALYLLWILPLWYLNVPGPVPEHVNPLKFIVLCLVIVSVNPVHLVLKCIVLTVFSVLLVVQP